MDKRILNLLYVTASIVTSIILINLFVYSEIDVSNNNNTQQNCSVKSINIPDELYFCDEKVPLKNFDVVESFDKELLINTYWQSQTILFIKRANKYFPIIESILKEQNVPDDFKYLALAESGLENVVSPAGAKGFWQFLEGTGKEYGLEINKEVDERYHIEKSTRAACKYLNKAYKKFGSWAMAAASYNIGRTNLLKQISRQKTDNYYDLVLGEETGRYIYRILAIKTILENPEKYGFCVSKNHLYFYPKYEIAVIDTSISDLAVFAKKNKTNYKILKELNPWLRDNYLTVSKSKKYEIKIPKKGIRNVEYNNELY